MCNCIATAPNTRIRAEHVVAARRSKDMDSIKVKWFSAEGAAGFPALENLIQRAEAAMGQCRFDMEMRAQEGEITCLCSQIAHSWFSFGEIPRVHQCTSSDAGSGPCSRTILGRNIEEAGFTLCPAPS